MIWWSHKNFLSSLKYTFRHNIAVGVHPGTVRQAPVVLLRGARGDRGGHGAGHVMSHAVLLARVAVTDSAHLQLPVPVHAQRASVWGCGNKRIKCIYLILFERLWCMFMIYTITAERELNILVDQYILRLFHFSEKIGLFTQYLQYSNYTNKPCLACKS